MTAIDQSIVDPTNEQVSHLKLYDDEPTDQPTDQRAGFERWQLYDDEPTNQQVGLTIRRWQLYDADEASYAYLI